MTYAIRFDFPTEDGPLFGGLYQGACGWAPTLATAFMFEDADEARQLMTNGYGNMAKWARVIKVSDGGAA